MAMTPSPSARAERNGAGRALALWGLAMLAVCLFGWTAVDAIQFTGTGESWSVAVYKELGADYVYVQDDFALTYVPLADGDNVSSAVGSLMHARVGFVSTAAAISATNLTGQGRLHSVPVMATALALAYDPTALGAAADDRLVLDASLLAAVWAGNLTRWNDTRLAARNPWLAATAAGEIALVYCNDTQGEGDVLWRYLALADDALAARMAAGGFAALAPVAEGRARSACSLAAKLQLLAQAPAALATVMWPDMVSSAAAAGLAAADYATPDGGLLAPNSTGAVSAAMALAAGSSANGTPPLALANNGTGGAWPLSALASALVATDIVVDVNNCLMVGGVFDLVSWVQLNNGALDAIARLGYTALDAAYRRATLDALTGITCGGNSVLTTSYLLGSGPYFPVYTALTNTFSTLASSSSSSSASSSSSSSLGSSTTLALKYYASTSSLSAITDMIDSTLDYGTTGATLTAQERALIPDALLIPSIAYGMVFSYNLPELLDAPHPVVLDYETVVGIYMGTVDTWDHPNITRLNSDIAHLLPAGQPIVVLYIETPQILTLVVNTAMSIQVPAFAAAVGNTTSCLGYPVLAAAPNRTHPIPNQNYVQEAINGVPYIFGASVTFLSAAADNTATAMLVGPWSGGEPVAATMDSVAAALGASADDPSRKQIYFAAANGSWPTVAYNSFIVRSRDMADCAKARALTDFIYWMQSSPEALAIMATGYIAPAGRSPPFMRHILLALANVTCDGVRASSIAGCVAPDGTLCSGRGACYGGACVCNASAGAWMGPLCDRPASGSADVLAPVLASTLPVAAALLACLAAAPFALFYAYVWWQRRHRREAWEIDIGELEFGPLLGQGGYGEVHRAVWRGTEVAVKQLNQTGGSGDDPLPRRALDDFVSEMRVTSGLRHPNVILFMAACTRPPHLAIVMEYMALGSLYDLLHNELVPDVPFVLRIKLAYQAAKGMHFLHSSGVVHRDLKSLNMLLDTKWNLKISDFGLTKLREDLAKKRDGGAAAAAGSVPWMAPEVLADQSRIDHTLADVYSFAIVMWELLTRERPYEGLSNARIAVAVMRDGLRPRMPPCDSDGEGRQAYVQLVDECWHADPNMRPTFGEAKGRLQTLHQKIGGHSGSLTTTTTSSSSSNGGGGSSSSTDGGSAHTASCTSIGAMDSGLTMKRGRVTVGQDSEGDDGRCGHGRDRKNGADMPSDGLPRADVSFAVCDLHQFADAWRAEASAAARAVGVFGGLVRKMAGRHGGHVFSHAYYNSGGTYFLAFGDPRTAAAFATGLIQRCAGVEALRDHARAALHYSAGDNPAAPGDMMRAGYRPQDYQDASGAAVLCRPGFVLCTRPFCVRLREARRGDPSAGQHPPRQQDRRTADGSDLTWRRTRAAPLYALVARTDGRDDGVEASCATVLGDGVGQGLARRRQSRALWGGRRDAAHQAGDTDDEHDSDGDCYHGGEDGYREGQSAGDDERKESDDDVEKNESDSDDSRSVIDLVAEAVERHGLCSSNACPWILSGGRLEVGRLIGSGSYGLVHEGRYMDRAVAVKELFERHLTEDRMRAVRREAALLSGLSHPNVVQLVGLRAGEAADAVADPCGDVTLTLVAELMEQGSLRDYLDRHHRLSFERRTAILRDAARGVHFLHSHGVVHRDLKSSNLLVDDRDTVKVGDFGFATATHENATMTRCGTPAWTAPEVLSNEAPIGKAADVYSFGIVMWEVLTGRRPYAGRNIYTLGIEVIDGVRPEVPADCPPRFRRLMERCWSRSPRKRPTMDEVIMGLTTSLDV